LGKAQNMLQLSKHKILQWLGNNRCNIRTFKLDKIKTNLKTRIYYIIYVITNLVCVFIFMWQNMLQLSRHNILQWFCNNRCNIGTFTVDKIKTDVKKEYITSFSWQPI